MAPAPRSDPVLACLGLTARCSLKYQSTRSIRMSGKVQATRTNCGGKEANLLYSEDPGVLPPKGL